VNRSGLWASMLGIVSVAIALFVMNLALGNTPVLGLDLRGGVSVILAPTESASAGDLVVVRDLIRDELEQRGIAEPDVRVEGENIVVDLPGVKDQQQALDAVDIAGIVTLRPVVQCGLAEPEPTDGSTPPTTAASPTDTSTPDTSTSGSQPAGFRRAPATPDSTVPTDATAPPEATPSAATVPIDPVTGSTVPVGSPFDPAAPAPTAGQDVLPVRDTGEVCVVGVSGGTGEVFSRGSAEPTLDPAQGWGVAVNLRGDGEATWNLLASQCFSGSTSCPSRQLAIVLDDVIQSAPVVNAPSFAGTVSITGDFSEGEARDLARVLNRGAFPVAVEAQSVQTVSATLGNDSLRAAVVSGLIGITLVMLFMVAYYRKLSIVIAGGLIVWGMTVFSAAAFVSQATNYSLSLAGATGIIVAIGVTVDSYVVFFERLKDELRGGRSPRNAAPRSFKATWRTIVAADIVSILASAILFWLSVGSVKGFALYLGLTAVCDLIVCFFFTRPAVYLLTRTTWFERRPALGIGAPA
jgi:preprotein translocase subunit SecD